MPSAAFSKQREIDVGSVDTEEMKQLRNAEWLFDQLCLENSQILVLDCRSQKYFIKNHIRGAINVTLPSLLLRRLANGKLAISSLIKCNNSREIFLENYKTHTIVLCGGSTEVKLSVNSEEEQNQLNLVLQTLYNRLEQDGCQVVYLQDGFVKFSENYPEWCNGSSENSMETEGNLIGLQNLRIHSAANPLIGQCGTQVNPTGLSSEDFCDSCINLSGEASGTPCFEDPCPFPVEILPNLFLGNAKNSADMEALDKHKIRYILNVTSDLPNIFKHDPHIRYLQIPINDHWSQNLASFFPEAISFIDEARQKQLGVLVHCLAGISRSVTITVAYLMHKFNMPLNDAYEFVKKRKVNISPNFSFMGQLLDYEKELNLNPVSYPSASGSSDSKTQRQASISTRRAITGNASMSSICCNCPSHVPCVCFIGTTPDSGIDIGNWV
ncbi:Dual specificity protein phosphatase Mpk3 [Chamberlinius hualienensis]